MGEQRDFRVGPFSVGDLIAIGTIIFLSGAQWVEVKQTQTDGEKLATRVGAIEQVIPVNYVRRDEYREDIREIKSLLRDLNQRFDEDHARALARAP